MWILVCSLIVLGFVAAAAGLIRNRQLKRKIERGELDKMPEVKMVTDCGADSCAVDEGGLCELDCVLNGAGDIVYYDDEELDRYKGMTSDSYTDEQVDEFREIFDTMLEKDVPGWARSLQRRGIALPDSLKDEVFLILGEHIHN